MVPTTSSQWPDQQDGPGPDGTRAARSSDHPPGQQTNRMTSRITLSKSLANPRSGSLLWDLQREAATREPPPLKEETTGNTRRCDPVGGLDLPDLSRDGLDNPRQHAKRDCLSLPCSVTPAGQIGDTRTGTIRPLGL